MDYHKSEHALALREYGRNVQNMVDRLRQITDPAQRAALAEQVMRVMTVVSPTAKESSDYQKKLWDHLHRIANYELELEGAFEKPNRPQPTTAKTRISYPNLNSRYRHYGKNVELMVTKAMAMPEGPERDLYIRWVGGYMRVMLGKVNMGASDELLNSMVLEHLRVLSKGAINLVGQPIVMNAVIRNMGNISNSSQPLYVKKKKKKLLGQPMQRRQGSQSQGQMQRRQGGGGNRPQQGGNRQGGRPNNYR